jgi:predicted nucleic acid-binding protein
MMGRNRRIFLDTSVIFAAVLSETGGARKLFRLGEAGVIQLIVGPNILRECEEVIRRKVPASLPTLAYLLELGQVEVSISPPDELVEQAYAIVEYLPDAHVLAEAMSAEPGWFVTHDKEHFLKVRQDSRLAFRIGTPGDLIQALENEFTQP